MNNPNISVVIPLYNKQSHILNAIDSVLKQAHSPSEIVVIDDGSCDDSAKIVTEKSATSQIPIRLIKQQNQGVSVARNNGVKHAKYELVAFLDADDVWLPLYLDEMVNLLNSYPTAGFYASRYQCFAGEGKFSDANINMALVAQNGLNPNGMLLKNYFDIASKGDLPFMISSTMVSKKRFNKIGGFPAGERIGEDQDFFAKVALEGDIAYSPNINLLYSTVADNKATQHHVPEAECPFSQRLYQQQANRTSPAVMRYCAAHLCHLAKLNIQIGRFKHAKSLLADRRCLLKPKHLVGLYGIASALELTQQIKQLFTFRPVFK